MINNFSSSQPTVIQQPQSIQYQIIQTEDGVQMVQEIQTVQAVEAVEMPKVKEFFIMQLFINNKSYGLCQRW